MNTDLAMIMADCDTPYAIVPPEMAGIDGVDENTPTEVLYDKLLEVNNILKTQFIVVVPSVIENVDGLFLLQYSQEMDECDMAVIEMFVRPIIDRGILDRIGAAELASLLPEKV